MSKSWQQELERWRSETLAKSAGGARKDSFVTSSGLSAPEISVPRDGVPPFENHGLPGEFPYTRGVHASSYRGRLWTMRQYAGFGTAAESNERYHYLLNQGQKALSVAFDLPTQMGYDSDAPQALGEVGRVGVAIDTVEDMELLFRGIPLDQVSTSMTINATASTLLALYASVGKRQGVTGSKLRGTIQNDILKEYIARGTWIYPPAPSMRIITDIFSWCRQYAPQWNTISISGYHVREAGCTAAQELAFTFGNAIAYVQAATEAGLAVDDFAPRLSFFFNVHNNLLEEVAKFRAARRLWARIMRERFGAKAPASMMLRFHSQTAGSTLTAQQPDNNVVRVTLQALAAVLGGTQSLHTNSRDEALSLPTEDSVRIALRTQQVIAYESGVADHVDPLGGSYLIEDWTDELEAAALSYLERIDGLGGMIAAIEDGFVQREIQDAAYKAQREIESGEQVVVGVNEFRSSEGEPGDLLRVDPELENAQRARLADFRKRRSQQTVQAALDALQRGAEGKDNVMTLIVDAVDVGATLGEVSDALRKVFGTYREVLVV